MATYRKRKGSDTWHWREDCSLWPTKNFHEIVNNQSAIQHAPRDGEMCNQCRAKDRRDTATK